MYIDILQEAKQDLFKGADFYESQAFNLGDCFFDSLMSEIESLNIYVGIHIKVNNYHKMLAKRFPYAIYYKYDKNTIYIYAVLDCRSNPKKISQRLK